MPPVYFCVTVIALTLILALMSLILFQWHQKSQTQTLKLLETMTNLAASKDLETFQSLQVTNPQNLQSHDPANEPIPVMNDIAIAEALAFRLASQGLDPNLAYSNDDPDAFKDFHI